MDYCKDCSNANKTSASQVNDFAPEMLESPLQLVQNGICLKGVLLNLVQVVEKLKVPNLSNINLLQPQPTKVERDEILTAIIESLELLKNNNPVSGLPVLNLDGSLMDSFTESSSTLSLGQQSDYKVALEVAFRRLLSLSRIVQELDRKIVLLNTRLNECNCGESCCE